MISLSLLTSMKTWIRSMMASAMSSTYARDAFFGTLEWPLMAVAPVPTDCNGSKQTNAFWNKKTSISEAILAWVKRSPIALVAGHCLPKRERHCMGILANLRHYPPFFF